MVCLNLISRSTSILWNFWPKVKLHIVDGEELLKNNFELY